MMGGRETIDLSDDLPALITGNWSVESKHVRIKRYIDIARAARRRYVGPGRAGATYIELFSGPGRVQVRETDSFEDGSPLVAYNQSMLSDSPFSTIYVCDRNETYADAARQRLESRGASVRWFVGEAESTVDDVAVELPRKALHFAFLDPWNLSSIPFSILERLAQFPRMDVLVHLSVLELRRKAIYFQQDDSPLDRAFPGWRGHVDSQTKLRTQRAQLLEYYKSLLRNIGMVAAEGVELVENQTGQELYWLIFASRHPLAVDFWERIRSISRNRELF